MTRPLRSASTLGLHAAGALLSCAVLAGCPSSGATAASPAAPAPVAAATAVAPMHLNGQGVLVVPVQSIRGLSVDQERATAELLFALGERDPAVRWVPPQALRRSLANSPGFAQDPGRLPDDPFLHHGDRVMVEPLAGILRRYTALMDLRLALYPRDARWIPAPAGGGYVRMSAVVLDTRSARVVWYGEADGETVPAPDDAALASAAGALAARMIAAAPSQ
jgi:hypothetical protein